MRYQISKGYKAFGAQEIFSNITFEVKDKEKVAIVGRNGCGKTTLLKIIANEESLDRGDIHKDKKMTIGYLSQTTFFDENHTVEEEFELIFEELHHLEKQMEELTAKMQFDTSPEVLEQYGKYQEQHEMLGGYTYKSEIHNIFTKFGFQMEDLKKSVSDFSGGQKTRIAFVKLLLSKPDILLLDEPTNHLDLDTIKWLEGYVKRYPKAVVMVSHDRTFLDEVVDIVYELEFHKMNKYLGNYSAYVEAKKIEIERNQIAYRNQQEEIDRLETLIEKFRYKKNKAKFAQSKIKYLDRMERVELKGEDTKSFHASFKSGIKGGNQVLNIKDLEIGYDRVLCNVNLEVLRGQRIAIIGPNGKGKSTLMKTLMKQIPALSGSFLFGHQIEIGYFDQELAQFQNNKNVLETIWDKYPELNRTQVRTALGSFLFTGEDVFKEVAVLSGGEKVRLSFVDLMLQKPNVLLLDEPTNHLDIIGKEALEESLLNYDGTMLFVSHDRYFISKMANGILKIDEGKAEYFPLTYKELNEKEEPKENIQVKESIKKEKPRHINYGREVSKLEVKIQKAEEKLASLRELRYEPEYYHDPHKMNELDEEIDGVHNEINAMMKQWEEYSEYL
ncbi:ATP-binding cassette subfamily F protein 3 [Breznakia sp. PF5-3]|uniref:ribosomal protection-like ABC-F family protein n=1 Tax=unclassified Breznakia TaxID=2623764 RepID=UPI002405E62F|nr:MULTISPECIES: ABC-F family ATP-binding cassette domain-containing protein [unclassified Breznakia]MDL2276407.1 ABC-F family ATP-binding cassette domain-containing protein [Breznakia sp. OttesenSCG-928-G09]MDF9823793.1 ATP-binding cassette subfamily F protein 3 [Breznakia sp. PM6-1]MDF9834641.1 ATP-binding cassette subfamily F protein 3 [Breznakia sp. PF5-3]MDF9836742.1 ATP-binding cassette subfamily F protein 3 [Breznakia sp. PFB2-8]MDF9858809.1 ATP-binding cassette subfamily F protein 3 [B